MGTLLLSNSITLLYWSYLYEVNSVFLITFVPLLYVISVSFKIFPLSSYFMFFLVCLFLLIDSITCGLSNLSKLPADQLKLIFKGKVLKKGDDKLSDLNIVNGSCLHMVHNKPKVETTNSNPFNNTNTQNTNTNTQNTNQQPQNPFGGMNLGNLGGMGGMPGMGGMGGMGGLNNPQVQSMMNNPQMRQMAQYSKNLIPIDQLFAYCNVCL